MRRLGGAVDSLGFLKREKSRKAIPFRSVNRRNSAGFDPGFQRHHLLPRQLLSKRCFGPMFTQVGRANIGFDDFRHNGLMLPANEATTLRTGIPLHRGPHRRYNELVIERVGRIEAHWREAVLESPETAFSDILMRLRLLQNAIRRRLLQERRRFLLNRRDPLGTGFDFNELDAMAESLWQAD